MWVVEIDLVLVCGPEIARFSVGIEIDLVGRNWLYFSVGDRSFISEHKKSGLRIPVSAS